MEDFNNNSPYVPKPDGGFSVRENNRMARPVNGMARAARVCGILSVISIFTFMIYPAIVIGSLAIILALLSRGEEKNLSDMAKTGMTTGIIAMVVNVAILGMACMLLFSDGEYKAQINDTCKQMYGQTFDDMIEDAKDGSLDLEYRNLPQTLR